MSLGIIRVLTTADDRVLGEHGRLLERDYAIRSVSRCIPEQPNGIHDDASEALAVPKILTLGHEFEREGCQALFLSCAADPGLEALRAAVRIPVFSAGSSAARIAQNLALPVAVLGITAEAPRPYRRILGERVAYARPEGVTCTNDLLHPDGVARAVSCVRGLMDQGARVIAFSCTGFSTIGLAAVLRRELGCVAIDAVAAAGMFASEVLGRPA